MRRQRIEKTEKAKQEITLIYDQQWKNMALYGAATAFLLNLAYNEQLQKHPSLSFCIAIIYVISSWCLWSFMKSNFQERVNEQANKLKNSGKKDAYDREMESCNKVFDMHGFFIIMSTSVIIIAYFDTIWSYILQLSYCLC